MRINKGILLIATGHANYGNMAYNLALTIKSIEDIPVAVVWSDNSLSHLSADQVQIFDHKIELPNDYRTGFGVKLHLDQLTPFNQTLCLDVDMLWLGKKPSELFEVLSGVEFTIITEGDSDSPNPKYYFWADAKEIKEVYKVDKVWQTRSEVMYFEKGTKVFKKAREINPVEKLRTIRRFGEFIPDELHFNIAMAVLGVNPHQAKWMPAYWNRLHNEVMPNLSLLYREYYLLSFGSNAASPIMKRAYDNVMQVACNKLRLPYQFKLKSKKEWAPGRLKI
jgi:hypothetical protein